MPNRAASVFITALIAILPAAAQTTALKAAPASLSFTHTLGATTFPAVQSLAVSPTSGAAVTVGVAVSGASWLTVTPASGKTNLTVKVNVNPTGLSVGNYTADIVLTPAGGTGQNVPVTLSIKAPPATLVATPNPVSVSYTRGDAAPAPSALNLSSGGALLSYAVTISGATWLSATPKSGIIFPAFSAQVALSVDPTGLAPGIYKGTVKIDAPSAANKTTSVTVELTVNPGLPTLNSIFPTGVSQGSGATTITLTGDNFFSGTTIKAGATTLASTLLGTTAIQATIPSSLLALAGTLSITATNPGTGGGTSSAQTFTVFSPGPRITGVTNGASYAAGTVAPGEFISVFGTGLGPDTIITFQPPTGTNPIASSLAGVSVSFGGTAAPLIFVSSTQIAAMVPYALTGPSNTVAVTYNGLTSSTFTVNVASSSPGLFALGASGSGPGAVFNLNEATGELTLNTETNTAVKGSTIWLYATGAGATTPAGTDGAIVTAESNLTAPVATLTIGGTNVTPDYFGPAPGLVSGLLLIKAKVPTDIAAARAVPVLLTINSVPSQDAVTISVK